MPFTGNYCFVITDGWKDTVTYNEAVKFVYTLLYVCVLCDSFVSTCGAEKRLCHPDMLYSSSFMACRILIICWKFSFLTTHCS